MMGTFKRTYFNELKDIVQVVSDVLLDDTDHDS